MSTADRMHSVGKKAPRKRPATWRRDQNKYIEARQGATAFRRKIWEDHKYDCDNGYWGSGHNVKHKQMESCSLYAHHANLWGEMPDPPLSMWDQGRFDYSITDGHW